MTDNTKRDPIDALIPPPRPHWVRFIFGAAILGVVGFVAFLWGFGYGIPRPECCGSGSSSTLMALTPDGEAVTVTATFFNSSSRELIIEDATAELPGAEVQGIAVLPPDSAMLRDDQALALPASVAGRDMVRALVTFVPTSCLDEPGPWGTVWLDLQVADMWFPTLGRSYELPDPVVAGDGDDLVVLPPESLDGVELPLTPLAAACALLDG